MAKKVELIQKELDKLNDFKELSEDLKVQLKSSDKLVLIKTKELEKATEALTVKENELYKTKEVLKATETNLSELDKELSETKKTVADMSKQIALVNRANETLKGFKAAYENLRENLKTVMAHLK